MKHFKRIAVLLSLVLCLSAFAGCGGGQLEEIAAGLSTYTIQAEYDEASHTLKASMTLDYVNNYDTELSSLSLHLYGAAYREGARYCPISRTDEASAYPAGKSYGSMSVDKVCVNSAEQAGEIAGSDSDVLCVSFPDKLLPGGKAQIQIDYTLTLANVRHRLGWYGYSVNLGNFYPVACVYENGAFRTDPYYSSGDPFYTEAANYDVTLTAPAKYKIACTGTATEEAGEDKTTVHSTARAVRDFAAVLGEYEVLSASVGDTEVKYYYHADDTAEGSLKAATDALTTFNDMFGDYPYSTYNVVQTAFLQGGMEYPNLVMISDVLSETNYIDAIVHETAHQWWYGVVGNDEVSDPWLDEGLTEYSTTLFFKKNEGYGVDFEKRIADALSSYMLYEELYKPGMNADTSMDRALPEYVDSMEYTYMTYVKGQLMFDNLRRLIGDDSFYAALKAYYKENFMKIATPDCLIACFEKASLRELKSYFNSWTEGKVQMFNK